MQNTWVSEESHSASQITNITVCTLFVRIFASPKVWFPRKQHEFPLFACDPRVTSKPHEFPLLFREIPWALVVALLAPTDATEGFSVFRATSCCS